MMTPILEEIQVTFITFENKLLNLACGDVIPRDALIEPSNHATLANTLLASPFGILKQHVTSSLLNGCSCTTDTSRVTLLFNHMSLIWKTRNDQAL
jgi:hypothetical protein